MSLLRGRHRLGRRGQRGRHAVDRPRRLRGLQDVEGRALHYGRFSWASFGILNGEYILGI